MLISPHQHCESQLTGSPIATMVKRAKDLGRKYFAYTDLGHLSSALKVYGMAKKAELKPVLGMEFYFKDSKCDIVTGTPASRCRYFTGTVFAKTQKGYQDLVKIASKNDLPKIDVQEETQSLWGWAELEELSKSDTLLVLGGPNCMVGKALLASNAEIAERVLLKAKALFGDRLSLALVCEPWGKKYATVIKIDYVDGTHDSLLASDIVTTDKARKIKASDLISRNGHREIKSKVTGSTFFEVNKFIEKVTEHKGFLPLPVDVTLEINKFFLLMSEKHGIKLLASDYAFYATPEDRAVQTMVLEGANQLKSSLHMKTTLEFGEYLTLYMGLSLEKSVAIAKNTDDWAQNFDNFSLKYGWRLADGGGNELQKCMEIIKAKGLMQWNDPVWTTRLREEISVIAKNKVKDLSPYFLPIHDVIAHYEENGRLTGPGRGSSAGSLIAYLMGITKVNPFTYDLSFNRFYSTDRIEAMKLADIDSDLESRDLLVGEDGKSGYLYGRWGNKAAQISTRGKIRLKSAIKDTNRYLKGSVEKEIEALTKALPDAGQGITDDQFLFGFEDEDGNHIDGLIETSEVLQKYAANRPQEWAIVQQALGLTRSFSKHACISGEALIDNNGRVSKFKDSLFSGNKPITVWSSGIKETVFVSFNNGITIKCTPDHKFITGFGGIEETEAKDLFNLQVSYKPFSSVSGDKSLDTELLFALGWGLNDGTFNKDRSNQCFHFTKVKDLKARIRIFDFLKSLNVKIWNGREDELYCGSENLPLEFFESKKNSIQRLPGYFWSLDFKSQCTFMNGFMSANGYVISTVDRIGFKISSRLLASDICSWMIANGINTNAQYISPQFFKIRNKEFKNNGCVEVSISGFESKQNFKKFVGFFQSYKAEKLRKIAVEKHPKDTQSQRSRPTICVDIVPGDKEEVFDFNEPTENVGYVNGILVHNCAFVIADKAIVDFVPVKEGCITQYEAKACEEAGLVKYDFLVINQLKDLRVCLDLINKKNGEKNKVGYFTHKGKLTYIWDLPSDSDVYKSVWGGATESCFQINTTTMTPFVKDVMPQNMEDISIIQSLVRPGPLDYVIEETGRNMAEEYVYRRNGNEYKDIEILKKLIPETHSVLVYQEQVTKIAKELAGFSGSAAENLREAIGKKQRTAMLKIKPDFINGCLSSGKVTEEEAHLLWDRIVTFGRYAFNKSHAISYSFITYACMFLKHHYNLEFWAAILTNAKEKEITGKLWPHVKHLLAPPDINLSSDEMEIDYANNKIRAKLGVIRGMGSATIDPIVAGRPYKDIQDFVNRDVAGPALTRKLTHVGVLDSLFPPKLELLQKLQLFEDALEIKKFGSKTIKPKKDGTLPEPKKGEIPEEYLVVEQNPMKNAAIKKSILPSLLVGLNDLGKNYSKCIVGEERPTRVMGWTDDNGFLNKALLVTGEMLQRLNETKGEAVESDVCVAVTAFIVGSSIFEYKKGTQSALKVVLDCDGYVQEHVLWPNYFTKELTYPKELKKGNICTVFLKKRAGKDDFCSIQNIVIEA